MTGPGRRRRGRGGFRVTGKFRVTISGTEPANHCAGRAAVRRRVPGPRDGGGPGPAAAAAAAVGHGSGPLTEPAGALSHSESVRRSRPGCQWLQVVSDENGWVRVNLNFKFKF